MEQDVERKILYNYLERNSDIKGNIITFNINIDDTLRWASEDEINIRLREHLIGLFNFTINYIIQDWCVDKVGDEYCIKLAGDGRDLEIWFRGRQVHRDRGPSMISSRKFNRDKRYYWHQYGKRHRLNGPAVVEKTGYFRYSVKYYLDGDYMNNASDYFGSLYTMKMEGLFTIIGRPLRSFKGSDKKIQKIFTPLGKSFKWLFKFIIE